MKKTLAMVLSAWLLLFHAAPGEAFVRVVKDADNGRGHFYEGATPIRFVGVNINQLPWADWRIDGELDYAKSIGAKVVRVWGVDSGTNAGDMAAKLRTVLDKAHSRQMYVIIALTHNYKQENWLANYGLPPGAERSFHLVRGDEPYYSRAEQLPDLGTVWMLDNRWIEYGYQVHYKGYVSALVMRLADHPALFAWDIANEVNSTSSHVEWTKKFYVEMARFIKSLDSNHMVTTGLIATRWAGLSPSQRDEVYKSPNIDFITVHQYLGGGHVQNNDGQDEDIGYANRNWKKPVVVEEFGSRDTYPPNAVRAAENYYSAKFAPPGSNDQLVDGIMYFGVSRDLADLKWYIPDVRDGLNNLFRTWNARLTGCGHWRSGVTLNPGQGITSCNRRFLLTMQGDGNLVLYRLAANGNANGHLWHSVTGGRPGGFATMQTDGNLVVYGPAPGGGNWGPLWWSKKTGDYGGANADLYVQDDGNIAIREPNAGRVLWTSKTGGN